MKLDDYFSERRRNRPDADHGLFSPTGDMSKQSRDAAFRREAERFTKYDNETIENMPAECKAELAERITAENKEDEILDLRCWQKRWRDFIKINYRPRVSKRELDKVESRLIELGETLEVE